MLTILIIAVSLLILYSSIMTALAVRKGIEIEMLESTVKSIGESFNFADAQCGEMRKEIIEKNMRIRDLEEAIEGGY